MTPSPATPAYWQPEAECLDREELAQLQLERLEATLARVVRNVPFYRKRFDEARFDPDELRSAEDLRRLAFTTKADLRAAYPYGLFAVPLRDVVRLHASGGTGTEAVVMGYTRNDLKTWANLMARCFVAGGLTKDDVVQITFDYGLFTGAFGVHQGAERLGAMVIPTSAGNTKRQLKIMQDYKATALVATPSYALHLVEAIREAGINASALSLRRALLGGEPWSEPMRKQIEEGLHVTATDNYSVSEVIGPGLAGECLERDGLHVPEDHFLVEIVHPATLEPVRPGEPGELVVTTLTKEAFPLVRYRTRDLTALVTEPCPCGRTSVRLRRIGARSDDMFIVKSVNVFPSQIEAVLREVLRGEPRFQVLLERPRALDEATVLVAVSQETFFDEMKRQAELRDLLRRRIASECGVTFEVKLVDAQTLEASAGGRRVVDLRKV
jgi:phenylacetate-CoA ligase